MAFCPCKYHGPDGSDRYPSLSISIGDDGRILIYCFAACKTEDILESVDLALKDLFCPEGEEPAECISVKCESYDNDLLVLFDKVYKDFLALSPLIDEHRENLKGRGLSDDEINCGGYGSLQASRSASLAEELFEIYGNNLYQVPGFICGDDDKPFLMNPQLEGILIPVRDVEGKIVALKCRRSGNPKYVYFTSMPKGRSSGSPIHLPLKDIQGLLQKVRITEGELKADIATSKSGLFTIGVPGVADAGGGRSIL